MNLKNLRMTFDELSDLLDKNPEGLTLERDDGVIFLTDDLGNRVEFAYEADFLAHYPSQEAEFRFQGRDVVEAFGVQGVVDSVCGRNMSIYPVRVIFDVGDDLTQTIHFTTCGKAHEWHKVPSLKLVSRPKGKYQVLYKRIKSSEYAVTSVKHESEEDFYKAYPKHLNTL